MSAIQAAPPQWKEALKETIFRSFAHALDELVKATALGTLPNKEENDARLSQAAANWTKRHLPPELSNREVTKDTIHELFGQAMCNTLRMQVTAVRKNLESLPQHIANLTSLSRVMHPDGTVRSNPSVLRHVEEATAQSAHLDEKLALLQQWEANPLLLDLLIPGMNEPPEDVFKTID